MPWFAYCSLGVFFLMFCTGVYDGWCLDKALPSFAVIAFLLVASGYFIGWGLRIIKVYFF